MERVVILTGGNTGDVRHNLAEARRLLGRQVGDETTASSIMESEPWGFSAQDNFLNQVLVFKTELPAAEVLERCLSIEKELGRERGFLVNKEDSTKSEETEPETNGAERVYSSRPIDIDILFYGDQIIETTDLTVPHPRIHQREFVLTLLAEIMPGFMHPVKEKTMTRLLEELIADQM